MKKKLKVGKRQVLVVVGIALLLAAAASAGFLLQLLTRPPVSDAVVTPRLPDAVSKAQRLRNTGDTAGFDQTIKAALDDPKTDDATRYLLYIQQGSAFRNANQNDKAVTAYLQAEAIKQTAEVAELLADIYSDTGNKTAAIDYYKKAIDRTPSGPLANATKEAFAEKIRLLGGQP